MGRKPQAVTVLPRGIKIRTFKSEQRIQIAFVYQGVECRELMPPGAGTPIAATSWQPPGNPTTGTARSWPMQG